MFNTPSEFASGPDAPQSAQSGWEQPAGPTTGGGLQGGAAEQLRSSQATMLTGPGASPAGGYQFVSLTSIE